MLTLLRGSRRVRTALVLAALLFTGATPVRPVAAVSTSDELVDPRLSASQCALLGRAFEAETSPSAPSQNAGCSRRECAKPGDRIKPVLNAEVCFLDGRRSAPYATFVPARACRSLGRIWIAEINVCGSNPRRGPHLVRDSPLCAQPGMVYVNHKETEGLYDECVSPDQLDVFKAQSRASGQSVNRVASHMSPQLCALRPAAVFASGRCRPVDRTPLADQPPVGTLVVGDSVTWRGDNELQDRRPPWVIDALPGRTSSELADRVEHYLEAHAPPRVLVAALGANPGAHPKPADFLDALDLLPASTRLILVTPYREVRSDFVSRRHMVDATARGMQLLARLRPHTCVADWASYVRAHPDVLIDDVHPTSRGEIRWADFVSAAWTSCRA